MSETTEKNEKKQTGRSVTEEICKKLGLEVLPTTLNILGEKLDEPFDDTWPELEQLRNHVKKRFQSMIYQMKKRREREHAQEVQKLRDKGEIPVLSEKDRERALTSVMAKQPISSNTPSLLEAQEQQKPTMKGKASITPSERAALLEDPKNVFYEWKPEKTYAPMSWKDTQAAVQLFVAQYQDARRRHPALDDEEIRTLLKNRLNILELSKRCPMMFELCTSRKSDKKVFEGIRRLVAARKAVEEGYVSEQEAYPQVFAELAELCKANSSEKEAPDNHANEVARFANIEEALAMGAQGVNAVEYASRRKQISDILSK